MKILLSLLNIGVPSLQCVSDRCMMNDTIPSGGNNDGTNNNNSNNGTTNSNPFEKQCVAASDCANLPNVPANVTFVCDDVAKRCILPCSDVTPCPFGEGIYNFVDIRV